ncbi:LptF/LptG family permease [Carboxylicivirga marina]|uniref:LptF/LptG family permease n=1 Tax=Carboxylicivirga marina TaxID=2800988 RepID=UPI001F40DE7E|nr:LptF/LptG family permease [Carboxylicivirga marina]
MKKLHLFLLKSYISPLIATFFISLFVLLLQILWRYIDFLVGKGLDWPTLTELLFYAILQVIPMALPLAILLASLMTFGNLGENYELTAIKAAGVSLIQAMKPLIILTAIISILAFGYSDNVMPWANLKFHSMIYSIKVHQPELEIKEKVFTHLDDYSIKVEHKNEETGQLHGVMIYDHSNEKNPNTNSTVANKGSIKMNKSVAMMQITLHDGTTYEENIKRQTHELSPNELKQYRIDNFKKQIAFIEVDDTEFSKVDESGYANFDRMKNIHQLSEGIKSFKLEQENTHTNISNLISPRHINTSLQKKGDAMPYAVIMQQSYKNLSVIAATKKRVQNRMRQLQLKVNDIHKLQKDIIGHNIELQRKFTLPFTCFIFSS